MNAYLTIWIYCNTANHSSLSKYSFIPISPQHKHHGRVQPCDTLTYGCFYFFKRQGVEFQSQTDIILIYVARLLSNRGITQTLICSNKRTFFPQQQWMLVDYKVLPIWQVTNHGLDSSTFSRIGFLCLLLSELHFLIFFLLIFSTGLLGFSGQFVNVLCHKTY